MPPEKDGVKPASTRRWYHLTNLRLRPYGNAFPVENCVLISKREPSH